MRCIAHIDMDCFYAQVEANRLGIDCRTTPFILAQWGSLIAVNYPARAHGIQRFHTLQEARERCPGVVVGDVATYRIGAHGYEYHAQANRQTHKVALEPYRDASRRIFALLSALPDVRVEKASVDEAFVDVTAAAQRELDELRRTHASRSNDNSSSSSCADSDLDALRDVLSPGTRLVDDRTAEMEVWCAAHGTRLAAVYDEPMYALQRRLRAQAQRSLQPSAHPWRRVARDGGGTATKRARSPSVIVDDDDNDDNDDNDDDNAQTPARYAVADRRNDDGVGSDAFSVAAHLRDAAARAAHARNCLLLCAATRVVQRIRQRLADELNYDCSAGIAHNRLLAKCISARHKPNQQTLLLPDRAASALFDIPLAKLNGFGGKLGRAVYDVCNAYAASVARGARRPQRLGRRRDAHDATRVRRHDGHNSTSSDDDDDDNKDNNNNNNNNDDGEAQMRCRDVWLVPLSRLCALDTHDEQQQQQQQQQPSLSSASCSDDDDDDNVHDSKHHHHDEHDDGECATAQYVYYRVRGYASDVVSPRSMAKVMMASKVFAPATRELRALQAWVEVLASELCTRYADFVRMYGVEGRSLNVKLGSEGLRRMGGVCNRTLALPYLVTVASLTTAVMHELRALFAATTTSTRSGSGGNNKQPVMARRRGTTSTTTSMPLINCIALTITRFVPIAPPPLPPPHAQNGNNNNNTTATAASATTTHGGAMTVTTSPARRPQQQTLLTAFAAAAAAAVAQQPCRHRHDEPDSHNNNDHNEKQRDSSNVAATVLLSQTSTCDDEGVCGSTQTTDDVDSVVVVVDDDKDTRMHDDNNDSDTKSSATRRAAMMTTPPRARDVLTSLRDAAAAAAAAATARSVVTTATATTTMATTTAASPHYIDLHDDDDDDDVTAT